MGLPEPVQVVACYWPAGCQTGCSVAPTCGSLLRWARRRCCCSRCGPARWPRSWAVVGGNLVSALVGVACASLIDDPLFVVAATAVLGGPAVTALGFGFALAPVLLNSACMVGAALLLNNLLRHHRYPHVAHTVHAPAQGHRTADPLPSARFGFTRADLDAVVQDYEELLDISEDDLEAILRQVEVRAFARRTTPVSCADIMSRDVISVDLGMSVEHAWHLLEHHQLRALPATS